MRDEYELLMERVLRQIVKDVEYLNLQAIDKLLRFIDEYYLKAYVQEVDE